MTRTKLQQWTQHKNKKEYPFFRSSLPKALVDALKGKGGDYLEWTVSDGKLVAEIIRR